MLVSRGVTEFGKLLDLEFKRGRPTTRTLAKYNLYKKMKIGSFKRNGQKIRDYMYPFLDL